jgi:hypothetical protein
MKSSRFASPTSALDLDGLLRRARKALWAALGLALAVHLAVVGVNPFQQTLEKAPRPLTTRFVKREPRLTKPLELRKIPQPKRQLLRRQVKLAAARMDQVQATAAFDTRSLIGQIVTTSASLIGEMPTASLVLEPALMSQAIQGTRQPENKIDMGLEMLDVNSMDTGRYRAMVVQDPGNPQAIKGFVKIARVTSELQHQGYHAELRQEYDNLSMLYLVQALKTYTDLQVDFLDHMTIADERLLETPIIIPTGSGRPSEQELEQLARYVIAGGFVIGGVSNEALIKYGGLVEGRDFFRERIPNDHPLYNCFFALGGPAISTDGYGSPRTRNDLSGLWIGDRLAAANVNTYIYARGRTAGMETTRNLHLGVNTVVFALTQEGSMTQRLMQMVE